MIAQQERDDKSIYQINVRFESHMLGVFKQWIVFDFNEKPVVIRKLSVSVGGEAIPEATPMSKSLWDSANTTIVRCKRTDKEAEKLEGQFKLSEFRPEVDISGETKLNSGNYKHLMHHMLWMEETEYKEKLAR